MWFGLDLVLVWLGVVFGLSAFYAVGGQELETQTNRAFNFFLKKQKNNKAGKDFIPPTAHTPCW